MSNKNIWIISKTGWNHRKYFEAWTVRRTNQMTQYLLSNCQIWGNKKYLVCWEKEALVLPLWQGAATAPHSLWYEMGKSIAAGGSAELGCRCGLTHGVCTMYVYYTAPPARVWDPSYCLPLHSGQQKLVFTNGLHQYLLKIILFHSFLFPRFSFLTSTELKRDFYEVVLYHIIICNFIILLHAGCYLMRWRMCHGTVTAYHCICVGRTRQPP